MSEPTIARDVAVGDHPGDLVRFRRQIDNIVRHGGYGMSSVSGCSAGLAQSSDGMRSWDDDGML